MNVMFSFLLSIAKVCIRIFAYLVGIFVCLLQSVLYSIYLLQQKAAILVGMWHVA